MDGKWMQRGAGEGDAKQREPNVSGLCGGAGQLWGGASALLQLGWHRGWGDRPTDRGGPRGGEANAVLGTLDFCVVGSEAPLKSFELREGETDENRVEFCKDYSAISAGWWRVAVWGIRLGFGVCSTVR